MPNILIAIVMAVTLFFGGTAAVVQAAAPAVPGQILYPVDRAVEQVRLALAFSPAKRAEVALSLAEERMQEIQTLLQQGQWQQAARAA